MSQRLSNITTQTSAPASHAGGGSLRQTVHNAFAETMAKQEGWSNDAAYDAYRTALAQAFEPRLRAGLQQHAEQAIKKLTDAQWKDIQHSAVSIFGSDFRSKNVQDQIKLAGLPQEQILQKYMSVTQAETVKDKQDLKAGFKSLGIALAGSVVGSVGGYQLGRVARNVAGGGGTWLRRGLRLFGVAGGFLLGGKLGLMASPMPNHGKDDTYYTAVASAMGTEIGGYLGQAASAYIDRRVNEICDPAKHAGATVESPKTAVANESVMANDAPKLEPTATDTGRVVANFVNRITDEKSQPQASMALRA